MKISNLQFITNYQSEYSHLEQVEKVIAAGVDWVQYRPKAELNPKIVAEAQQIADLCKKNDVTLIINDLVELATQIDADGVHLGKSDMSPSKAREILGKEKIIGGTANTIEDIENLVNQAVDYIGLGPFRPTNTKKNLSPVLGLSGYDNLVAEMKQKGVDVPVVAIGGIKPEHVKSISETGIFGIAVSSVLSESDQVKQTTNLLREAQKS
jgi:thiamine-phosphate pyrophosphorylase